MRRGIASGLAGVVAAALSLGLLFGALFNATAACAAPAVDATPEAADWAKPTATAVVTYGSIYTAVLATVQSARWIIAAAAPLEWAATAQTFGTPLLVMPIMVQLIPVVRRWAPEAVDAMGVGAPVNPGGAI